MNSHGVYKGPVATHQLVVPVALSGAFHLDSNLAIALPVDPIYISLPRSEDHGLEPAKFSTSSAIDTCPTQGVTTLSRAVDPSNIPLPSDNGPSNTDDPNKSRLISNHYETEASADKLPLELNGTTGPAPAHSDDRDASLSSADMSLESDFDATSHIVQGTIVTVEQDAGNNNKEPPVEDLPGSVWTDRILESRELFNDQAADDITVSNMTANMSLSSDILDELGGAVQERPANEPVKMAPRGEDIDHGNARLLEVPTVYPGLDDLSISSLGVSAPENHSAQITSLSQTAALIVPADTQRDNGDNSIDVSMDMSLETNAGNTEGEGNVLATDANVDGDKTSPFTDDDSHSTIPPSQDSFTMLPTTSSSEMITQEQADTFFDETSIGSFAEPPLLGLSTIEEENSLETRLAAQEEPTSGIYDSTNSSESTEHDSSPGPPSKISIAYGLPTEDSLDVTADMSLESQILDTDLRALEKSGDSWDGLATQMEKPHYRPDEPSGPLSDTHPALDSGLAWMTAAEEGPSEDIRTTTLETLEPDMDISELGMTTWTPDMDPCASTPDLDTLLSKSCPASLPGLVPIPPRPSSPDLAPAPLDHADSTVSDVDYTSEHESRAPTKMDRRRLDGGRGVVVEEAGGGV
ncbi:hypothetical protein FRC07_007701 [Ceratobasidium sp. 392]|nr:hypothetical protein FRC07_007701 [Ceratobasidium sp. 392]